MKNLKKSIGISMLAIALVLSVSFTKVHGSAPSKAVIEQIATANNSGTNGLAIVRFYDSSDSTLFAEPNLYFSITGVNNSKDFQNAVNGAILDYASNNSFAITADDIVWPPTARPTQATATHSFTTSTGATGFQVSALHDSEVRYNVTIATTATIGGNSDGTVVLEIAPTNSSTAGDWVEVGRFRNGQAISLALTLQSVQTMGDQLTAFVPAGYYVKLRTINNSGTPTYTYNSGQEVME